MTSLDELPAHMDVQEPRRRRLTMWCSIPPVAFFVVCLVLMNFTTAFDGLAFGPVSWAIVVALIQFVVAIAVGHTYVRRAAALDNAPARLPDADIRA